MLNLKSLFLLVAIVSATPEASAAAAANLSNSLGHRQVQQPKSTIGVRGIMAFFVAGVDAGSPADQAGLQKGDMITELDGVQINSIEDVQRIAQTPAGTPVEITYWGYNSATSKEDRHQATIKTTLLGAPDQPRTAIGARGMMVFIVASVDSGSPANLAGLNRGDVITELSGAQVNSIVDVLKTTQNPPGTSVEVVYWRRNPNNSKHEKRQVALKTSVSK